MQDNSPLDESVFSIDSSEYDLVHEFNNPRKFSITSDGSVEQQGEYHLGVGYYLANDPPPNGHRIRFIDFVVTILPSNTTANQPPHLESLFNETYTIRVKEKQRICWTPVDEDQDPDNLIITEQFE